MDVTLASCNAVPQRLAQRRPPTEDADGSKDPVNGHYLRLVSLLGILAVDWTVEGIARIGRLAWCNAGCQKAQASSGGSGHWPTGIQSTAFEQ